MQTRLLPLHLLILLVVCVRPSTASSQPAPNITAISGCTDVGSVTWNCTAQGVKLTIYGTDFITDGTDPSVHFINPTTADTYCWIDFPIYATNLTCGLWTADRSFILGGRLEGVQLIFSDGTGPSSWVSTPTFYGVAFQHYPLPTITNISGCDDTNNTDGQYTANCDPTAVTITLTGIDFSVFHADVSGLPWDHLYVRLGDTVNIATWQYVSDTTILIPLWETYSRLLVPDHYTGTPLSLSLQAGQLTTNSVMLSFISPQPPPQVTSIVSESIGITTIACQSTGGNPPSASGCVPGVSTITIYGHHFYPPIDVYIGGKLCAPTYPPGPTANMLVCIVPLIDSYVPGFYYDMTLNDTAYADDPEVGYLPSAVSFVPGPVLSKVLPCLDTLTTDNSTYPRCQPGNRITIVGTDFLPADPAAVLNIAGVVRDYSGSCTDLVVVDEEHLVCTLPNLGAISQWSAASLTLTAFGNTSSNLVVYLYDSGSPINITLMTGCGNGTSVIVDGIPILYNCIPNEPFHINGYNIPTHNAVYVYDTNYYLGISVGYTCVHIHGTRAARSNTVHVVQHAYLLHHSHNRKYQQPIRHRLHCTRTLVLQHRSSQQQQHCREWVVFQHRCCLEQR